MSVVLHTSHQHVVRVVIDTNVWLDWLVFDDPGIAPLREARAAERIDVVIDADCEAELARVLGYTFGQRKLDAKARADCMAACHSIARPMSPGTPARPRPALPRCRDPDDQKFLALALQSDADFLITRDRALLELSGRSGVRAGRGVPFAIATPGEFAGRAFAGENARNGRSEFPTFGRELVSQIGGGATRFSAAMHEKTEAKLR